MSLHVHVHHFVSSLEGVNMSNTTQEKILFTSYGDLHLYSVSISLAIMVLVTIMGNSLVICAICCQYRLRNPSNALIASLAVADLLVGVFVMPIALLKEVSQKWFLGGTLCDMFMTADIFACTASILHLVAIALDRLWAVTDFTYTKTRTYNRTMSMAILCWILGLTVAIAPILGWRGHEENNPSFTGICLISQDLAYTIFSTFAAFYLPCLIILIIYAKIYMVSRKQIIWRSKQNVISKGSKFQHTVSALTRTMVKTAGFPARRGAITEITMNADYSQTGGERTVPDIQPKTSAEAMGDLNLQILRSAGQTERLLDGFGSRSPDVHGETRKRFVLITEKTRGQRSHKITKCEVTRSLLGSASVEGGAVYAQENSLVLRKEEDISQPKRIAHRPADKTKPPPAIRLTRPYMQSVSVELHTDYEVQKGNDDSILKHKKISLKKNNSSESKKSISFFEMGNGSCLEVTPPPRRRPLLAKQFSFQLDKNKWSSPSISADMQSISVSDSATQVGAQAEVLSASSSLQNRRKSRPALPPLFRRRLNSARPSISSLRGIKRFKEKYREKEVAAQQLQRSKRFRQYLQERKTSITLAILTSAFMACWLPFFVLAAWLPFCGEPCHTDPTLDILNRAFTWAGYLNSTINPIIYSVFNMEFRESFKRLIFGYFKRGVYDGSTQTRRYPSVTHDYRSITTLLRGRHK